jgi:arylsulfatase A-like enzyme
VRQAPLLSQPGSQRTACKSLLAVDELVSKVKAELSAQGRLQNTVFVYMGDNGMNAGEHRLQGKNAPYVTAIPFYVSWPARYGSSPRTISERVQNYDLAPTLCAIAGCTLGPYPTGQAKPDGVSFLALMDGTVSTLRRDAVLDELPHTTNGVPLWNAVSTTTFSSMGLWHYVEYPATGEKELYDVSNGPCWRWTGGAGDPCELRNRAGDPSLANKQAALAARLAELKK